MGDVFIQPHDPGSGNVVGAPMVAGPPTTGDAPATPVTTADYRHGSVRPVEKRSARSLASLEAEFRQMER